MMTEKSFSTIYTSFWKELLPGSERYIKKMNITTERFVQPLVSHASVEERGVTNEMGFRLFCQIVFEGLGDLAELNGSSIKLTASEAVDYIKRFRTSEPDSIKEPSKNALNEASILAERLCIYFGNRADWGCLICRPQFAGCGKIRACEGDVLFKNTLAEVKAGNRKFRMVDLRQVLTYCALNYVKPVHKIDKIVLLNPRLGIFFETSLEGLCREIAGATSDTVFNEITNFASESVTTI